MRDGGQISAVIGVGEAGGALANILERNYNVVRVDLEEVAMSGRLEAVHVCYPFQVKDFVGTTCQYFEKYPSQLRIIHSTVVPGTTREVEKRVGNPVLYSPIRGKHWKMEADVLKYRKFIAGSDVSSLKRAFRYFSAAGLVPEQAPSTDALELMKLLETTYFGLLIAWAQEIERVAAQVGCPFQDVVRFWEEIPSLLPGGYTPGFIGGHCVMPNIELLSSWRKSDFLDLIVRSNEAKAAALRTSPAAANRQA